MNNLMPNIRHSRAINNTNTIKASHKFSDKNNSFNIKYT